MADLITLTVDTKAIDDAFARVPDVARDRCLDAAEVSAQNVTVEAVSRVARRTGQTAQSIRYAPLPEQDDDIPGFMVFVDRPDKPFLAYWLEFGTQYMTARPFLFASAFLEADPHRRRIEDAIDESIAIVGLGE